MTALGVYCAAVLQGMYHGMTMYDMNRLLLSTMLGGISTGVLSLCCAQRPAGPTKAQLLQFWPRKLLILLLLQSIPFDHVV